MSNQTTRQILNEKSMSRVLSRIAHEIIERNHGASDLAIIGIRRRGDWLAKRLAEIINRVEDVSLPVGALDINLYRDDFQSHAAQPVVRVSEIPFEVEERTIILVDDVLFTGRTIRAALDELKDFGRARRIQLAVLINRDGRELPIQADYIGENVDIAPEEIVVVRVQEVDDEDHVLVERVT
ncbi:MAG TPA: bifunctional pyr operon transcriptional regulator/uracil phosphoribosyltransferase PyrR [candidate division Zixibacteria bacterium]|jgi:pyrimidine operon attenuation protein/uracil phosphoribosyltransferase|nr:bifunctional pyr operon transcriptional regulator/uracil phosphoribosyltransferase PyrR [Candidatus Latescibacterota bacterium]HIG47809.1 bifunctional pyr operon transcriptional regulator/uracil phosphoribosyltransferase PyrR [candidate division Zixibacteria bacterium]